MVCCYRLRRRNGGMGAIDRQGAAVSVHLSTEGKLKAMLETLIANEEKTLERVIRQHQFHAMELDRYEKRIIEVDAARAKWKSLYRSCE